MSRGVQQPHVAHRSDPEVLHEGQEILDGDVIVLLTFTTREPPRSLMATANARLRTAGWSCYTNFASGPRAGWWSRPVSGGTALGPARPGRHPGRCPTVGAVCARAAFTGPRSSDLLTPVRDVRNHFSDVIGRVEHKHEVSRSRAMDARSPSSSARRTWPISPCTSVEDSDTAADPLFVELRGLEPLTPSCRRRQALTSAVLEILRQRQPLTCSNAVSRFCCDHSTRALSCRLELVRAE